MKYDVFDVPLGLLREWSAGGYIGLDHCANNGRLMYAGVQVSCRLAGLFADGGRALGRYVVVESYATFGGPRFGRVFMRDHVFDTLGNALSYLDWCDCGLELTVADGFGYECEVWHVVEDAPSGSCTSDALCPSDSVEDGPCADGLAPELPAMALEVLRQLRDAGELGDPDELTDEDYFDASCYTGDLPLGVVTRSDFGCVFLPVDNVYVRGCDWVRFVPRDPCPGCFLFEDTMTFHLSDRTGIWNMLVNAYSDLDEDGWDSEYVDEIKTLCYDLFFWTRNETGCTDMTVWLRDELDRLCFDLKFGFDFGGVDYAGIPPMPVIDPQDDDFWDEHLSPVPGDDHYNWFDIMTDSGPMHAGTVDLDDDYWDECPARVPVDTWQEIDIQPSETAVL